jgi:hypothetical protein
MIFFWSGWGFLVPIILIVCFVATNGIVDAILGEKYYNTNGWPKLLAALLTAFLFLIAGWFFNHRDRITVDLETGEREVIGNNGGHTFFFIPMEYWSVPLVILSIALLFA